MVVLWYYKKDLRKPEHLGWHLYDDDQTVDIEKAYKKGKSEFDVDDTYAINFKHMMQYRKGDTSKQRPVKREEVSGAKGEEEDAVQDPENVAKRRRLVIDEMRHTHTATVEELEAALKKAKHIEKELRAEISALEKKEKELVGREKEILGREKEAQNKAADRERELLQKVAKREEEAVLLVGKLDTLDVENTRLKTEMQELRGTVEKRDRQLKKFQATHDAVQRALGESIGIINHDE